MSIINIESISKSYGEHQIFSEASFGILSGDKVGIIGANGSGKSTLLKMVAEKAYPDSGQIVLQNQIKMAYLPQSPVLPLEQSIDTYIGHGDNRWKIEAILDTFHMNFPHKIIGELSGGQKRRVALAKVLANDFDLLLLDEPTNHLDDEMVSWLEEYLNKFRGTLLMVTHDRYFLDKVCHRILEIDQGEFFSYDTNYSGFLERKAERMDRLMANERKRKSMLRMELEWAKRGCRARSTKQRARLDRLEELKKGVSLHQEQVVLDTVESRMGKKTIELHQISKAYQEHVVVRDFTHIFLKNQAVGIIGPNGCGKSTLLQMIAGNVLPDQGTIEVGETIKIGYFTQETPDFDENARVIDYVKDIAEYIQTKEGKISASQMLERFLFTPEMQYGPIGKLSGGEKRRLYLLGVLSKDSNVLLLDEPGNDLDIPTLTILEDFLNVFNGIVIVVSHDRYFLDNVVDKLFVFLENGKVVGIEGGYSDYERKKEMIEAEKNVKAVQIKEEGKSENNWRKKNPSRLKFSYNEQREFEHIDEDIAGLETQVEEMEKAIMANATNSMKLGELMKEKELIEQALEEKMERWVYLHELKEKIDEQN